MRSPDDDTDLEAVCAISDQWVRNSARNVEVTTSKRLSLLKIGRASAQWRRPRAHAQL